MYIKLDYVYYFLNIYIYNNRTFLKAFEVNTYLLIASRLFSY